jgi:hypothetical protein
MRPPRLRLGPRRRRRRARRRCRPRPLHQVLPRPHRPPPQPPRHRRRLHSSWWTFPALILLGGAATLARDRSKPPSEAPGKEGIESLGVGKPAGAALLVVWLGVLDAVIALRGGGYPYEGSGRALHWFEAFYRTGSIIYGGDQAISPLNPPPLFPSSPNHHLPSPHLSRGSCRRAVIPRRRASRPGHAVTAP